MRGLMWLAGVVMVVVLCSPHDVRAQSSVSHVFHAAQGGTSNGTPLRAEYYSTIGVQVEGTWSGTLTFRSKTKDAGAYVDTQCRNRADGAMSTTTTGNGYFDCPGPAYEFIVASSVSSGSVSVSGLGSIGAAGSAAGGGGGSSDGIVRDGTGDTTQANVINGRLQVENLNPNLAADNSTNSTSKVPTMPCTANAGAPSWTEGRQVPCSVDLNGYLRTRTIDPCSYIAKTHIPINISTATTTELTASLAGASTHYYVCSLDLVTAGANNVALVDDDSDGCGSVTSGLAGGTTAASGWNFAANGGMAKGNGGSTVFKTGGTNRVICLVTSAATQLSGSIQVVAAP